MAKLKCTESLSLSTLFLKIIEFITAFVSRNYNKLLQRLRANNRELQNISIWKKKNPLSTLFSPAGNGTCIDYFHLDLEKKKLQSGTNNKIHLHLHANAFALS